MRRLSYGIAQAAILQGTVTLVLAFLVLPALIVVPLSLTDTSYLALPQHGLSLQYWRALFTDPQWANGFVQSLGIGACATVLATTAGTLCAIACWRLSSRVGEAIRVLMLVPLIVPTIVYALGLYRFFADLGLLDSFTGVILAHACIGMPYVVITVGAALANFDRRLELAARSLGAPSGYIVWRVILPNIRAGILSGAVFAFITSWDELVIVLFIASRRVQTLPRLIWTGVQESLDPTIAVVAVVLIGVTILAMLPTFRASSRNLADGS